MECNLLALNQSLSSVTNQHKTKHPTYCNIHCFLFKFSMCVCVHITFKLGNLVMSISGFTVYLAMEHNVEFPPNQYWYCTVIITVLAMAMLCGTFTTLLVAMTFDRFYSIIRPHYLIRSRSHCNSNFNSK